MPVALYTTPGMRGWPMAMMWCFSDLIHDRPTPMLQLVLDIRMMRLLDLYLHRRIWYVPGGNIVRVSSTVWAIFLPFTFMIPSV